MNSGLIAAWRPYLPDITDTTPIISLNEGNTPLIEGSCLDWQQRAQPSSCPAPGPTRNPLLSSLDYDQ